MANTDQTPAKEKRETRSRRGYILPDGSFSSDFDPNMIAASFAAVRKDDDDTIEIVKEWRVLPPVMTPPAAQDGFTILTPEQYLGIFQLGVVTKFGNEGNTVWNRKPDGASPEEGAEYIQSYIDSGQHERESAGRFNLDRMAQAMSNVSYGGDAEATAQIRVKLDDKVMQDQAFAHPAYLAEYRKLSGKVVTSDADMAALLADIKVGK